LDAATVAAASFDEALAARGIGFPRWLRRRRADKRQYVEAAKTRLEALRKAEPEAVEDTLKAAERFLLHRFDLLGSGTYVPVDPDRPVRGRYPPIDWYFDPIRGMRFRRGVPYKEWRLYEMRPENADIKYPWELARCQHWAVLAQAWQVSRDERFAREIAGELEDFVEANPVGVGINWTCTMDVAIRAANWALALSLLLDCAALRDEFWHFAYGALYDHALFIFGNLENHYEVTSNHYLSNVVGLHLLASEFSDLEAGANWDEFCRQAIETEIDVQVHEEGTDFESSVPYHRLVTELFMASARLAQFQGRPFPEKFRAKLARMPDFLAAIARPDGRMPVIGDADDGRLHIFSHFGDWDRQDGRHLMAPAALTLGRRDLLASAAPRSAWEAAWWGFDPADALAPPNKAAPAEIIKLFAELGVAVARRNGHYLAVTNGAVGTRGFGNHKHNELLSFEYHQGGTPVVVDPGSYVYTSDFAARNLFRGTAYHNTLMIDGVEQNELNPEWIFRLFEKANPEHIAFARDGDRVRYRGRHSGYTRLDNKVVHEREFAFDLASGVLAIEDVLEGEGAHEIAWHFHFAPEIAVLSQFSGQIMLGTAAGQRLLLTFDAALGAKIADAWYSPSYGVRVPTKALDLACHKELSGRWATRFVMTPAK
jgi:hypothetical protein